MPNTVSFDQSLPRIDGSNALLARAAGLIPAATQTLAKGPTQYVRHVAPVYLERGSGARVWDVDGNEYIDMTMAVGPLSLGYCYPRVDEAIREQLAKGISFSLVHPLEVEIAESCRKLIPGAERVRFSKTGCDVTTAAVRLARAYTGRDKVLCCGYHGWHDWYIGTTSRRAGVPATTRELVRTFDYNDLDGVVSALDDQVACVILEPVQFSEPAPHFLGALRRACSEKGVLLVFDEMWTGFRIDLGGAQARYDVKADLACFSKAVANGMPLSVLTGRADVMDLLAEDVFFFTTFGGETLSLAAAKATLSELEECSVPAALEARGAALRDGYNELAYKKGIAFTRAKGLGARTTIVFDDTAANPLEQKSLMQQELLRHGILWSGFNNLSYSHSSAELEHVLEGYSRALDVLASSVARGTVREDLRGTPVQPVFRPTR